jgi:hypothetical protein
VPLHSEPNFTYPGDEGPTGGVEDGINAQTMATIEVLASAVGASLDASPGQREDCRYASAAWERVLRARGIDVLMLGGEGVDDDVFRDYMLVRIEQRSGYRQGGDILRRHYWLGIGPERFVFDPTAHQFDDQGGVSLDRYVLDGRAVPISRERRASTR